MEDEQPHNHKKRNLILWIALGVFVFAGLVWFCFWLFYARFYETTDDAYVHGNQVMLTPQVSSGVKAIYAEETDLVEQGQLLVELDTSKYVLAFEQSQEKLAETVRQVAALFLFRDAKQAEFDLRIAELRQAELDLEHREGLVNTGAISIEEYEQYQTNVLVAEARVESAEREYEMTKVMTEGVCVETHPLVLESVTSLQESYLNLIRCQVLAPVTGYVAKRSVQAGDYVEVGDTLLDVVPLDYVWAEANFKETKLKNIRIGQPVTFTADMHGRGVKYHGKVVGFQAGSGSAFALLPAQNASGNWIKIVQRVPVRISIKPDEIRENPLFIGVSLEVSVDVHETKGSMIADEPTMKPIYTTPIYTTQFAEMEEIAPLIEQIIIENNTLLADES